MMQQSIACASSAVELHKFGDVVDVSDDDMSSSRSTGSGSPSEGSSGASRTTISRSFVWADEDSDDDFDVTSSFPYYSAGVSNQQSTFVPQVPPGCNQPVLFNGAGQQWAMVAVPCASFVPCAPSACFAQPAGWQPVTQSAAQTPAVRSQSLQAHAEADALEAQAEAYAARAQELREAARRAPKQAAAQSRETQVEPGSSPKSKTATEQFAIANENRTTLILKNLPADCTHDDLRRILDDVGLAGLYNFIYVPFDFKKFVALRYGFVNFENNESAVKAMTILDGFAGWALDGEKACEVEWSGAQQGLHANIERYRNSPVMHNSVPEAYKPVLFERGARITFPAPTQAVKPLKLRRAQQA